MAAVGKEVFAMAVKVATGHEEKTGEPAAQQVCHHHWVIGNADGSVSKGICKLCGARKEFRNYLRDCLQATEEEYEAWLAKQKDYAKASRVEENTLAEVGGES